MLTCWGVGHEKLGPGLVKFPVPRYGYVWSIYLHFGDIFCNMTCRILCTLYRYDAGG